MARMEAPVTLRDVARLAGVHPGTVSRALNPETRGARQRGDRRRVRDAARTLGYRPEPDRARAEDEPHVHDRRPRSPTSQPAVPADHARDRGPAGHGGLHAADRQHRQRPERERNDVEAMRARQVDGVITATARLDHELLDEVARPAMPSCSSTAASRTARCPRRPPTTARACGSRSGTWPRSATGGSPQLGGPQDLSTGHARHEGFVAAMARARARSALRCASAAHSPSAEGARVCEELLAAAPGRHRDRRRQRPDGARLLRRAGRARAGLPGARSRSSASTTCRSPSNFHPPLTTIRIPHYEIGAAAADLLLERLAQPGAPPRHVVLDARAGAYGGSDGTARLDTAARPPALRLHTIAAIVCSPPGPGAPVPGGEEEEVGR